jgi:hypothetical protein
MEIEGGTGNGYKAKVNSDNMLYTRAITESVEHYTNHDEQRAFAVTFNQSPTAANDCFFWIKNTDTERDLIIEGMMLGHKDATAVDPEVYMKLGDDGTANSGSDVTPVAVNTESPYSATCTCEKGADLDNAGSGITGGTEFGRFLFAAAAGQDVSSTMRNFPMDVILAPNGSFSLWATDAGATYYVNLPIWFIDRD